MRRASLTMGPRAQRVISDPWVKISALPMGRLMGLALISMPSPWPLG